jgi:Ca2+-binding EF-hand superfamily protein
MAQRQRQPSLSSPPRRPSVDRAALHDSSKSPPPHPLLRRDSSFSDEAGLLELSRDAGLAFLDADINGDQKLSFEEFNLVIPATLRDKADEAQIRELFTNADRDRSGYVSSDEYFVWMIGVAEQSSNCGLEPIFRRYDTSKSGSLDAREFAHACTDLGFGVFAHDIFMELDHDSSGTVSYVELIWSLRKRQKLGMSKLAKRFLTHVSFTNATISVREQVNRNASPGSSSEQQAGDLSTWRLSSVDVEGLRKQVASKLLEHKMRVSDFYNLALERSGPDALTRGRFPATMRLFGHTADDEALDALFVSMNADLSKAIGMDEIYAWMNGAIGRKQSAKEVRSAHSPPRANPPATTTTTVHAVESCSCYAVEHLAIQPGAKRTTREPATPPIRAPQMSRPPPHASANAPPTRLHARCARRR